MEYIVSGRQGHTYTELFERAIADGPFTRISAAVAYATVGGVKLLEETLREHLGEAWNAMGKKWLVGIDWCRSDPPALDRLASLQNSEVRTPDGAAVVARAGCTPSQTYHPKLFMLTGGRRTVIVCGSGNLSRNGLSRGCEIGGVVTLDGPAPEGAGRPRRQSRASAMEGGEQAERRSTSPFGDARMGVVLILRRQCPGFLLLSNQGPP